EDAERGLHVAQVVERLEGLQWIGEVLAIVVDARQARACDEIVGQDLVPQVHDFFRLREEAMAANVEQELAVAGGAADAPDIAWVGLDHRRGDALLRQQVGGRQPRRTRADYEHIRIGHGITSTNSPAPPCRRRGPQTKALPTLPNVSRR